MCLAHHAHGAFQMSVNAQLGRKSTAQAFKVLNMLNPMQYPNCHASGNLFRFVFQQCEIY